MRRGWKNFWIVCGVTAGIGAVCLITGKMMGATFTVMNNYIPGWIGLGRGGVSESYDRGSAPLEADSDQVYSGVRSLKVDTEGISVQILKGSGDGITVETEDIYSALKFEVDEDDGELRVETTAKSFPWRINKGNYGNVRICIPENYTLDEADLQTGIGELYVEDIDAQELKLEVGTGTADVDWFTADMLDMEVGVGEINAAGDTRKQADLECGVGSLTYTAAGSREDFNYRLSCSMGELNLDGESYSGLDTERTVDNHADKDMNVTCDVGSTNIHFEQ